MEYNIIYRTDFISDRGNSYRLEMIPTYTSALSNPTIEQFATHVFMRECTVSAEFDKLPIGMVSVGLMKLKLNASALTAEQRRVIFAGVLDIEATTTKIIVGGDTPTTVRLENFAGWVNANSANDFTVLRTEYGDDNGFSVEHVTLEVKQSAAPQVHQWNRFSVYEIVDQNGVGQGWQTTTVVQSFQVSTVSTVQQERNVGNVWRLTRLDANPANNVVMFEGVQKRNPSVKCTLKSDADTIIEIEIMHIVRAALEQVNVRYAMSLMSMQRENTIQLGSVKFGNGDNLYQFATFTQIQTALASELQRAYRAMVRNNSVTASVSGMDTMLTYVDRVVVQVYHSTARSVIDNDLNGFDFCSRLAENLFAKCVSVVSSSGIQVQFLPILDPVGITASAISNDDIIGDQEVQIGEDTIRGVSVSCAGTNSMELQTSNYGSKREGDFYVKTLWTDAVTADPPDGILTAYMVKAISTNFIGVLLRTNTVVSLVANTHTWSGSLAEVATARRAHAEQVSLAWVLQQAYLRFFGKRKARIQEQEIAVKNGYYAHNVGTVCTVSAIDDIAQPATTGVLISAEHNIVAETIKTKLYCFDKDSLPT